MFGMAGLGTVQAAVAILSGGSPFSWYSATGVGACGTFSGKNSFGGFLALTVVITTALVLSVAVRLVDSVRGRNLRVVLLEVTGRYEFFAILLLSVSVAAQYVALALTRSRGALISSSLAVAALGAWFLLARRRHDRNRFLRILAGVVLLAAVAGGLVGYVLSERGFGGHVTDASALSRLAIWRALPSMLKAHPFGVGLGCFGEGFNRFLPAGTFGMKRAYHAHNDYFELICELGIPGALLLLLALVLIVRRMIAVASGSSQGSSVWLWRGAALAVAAGMVHAAVDYNISSRPGVALVWVVLLGVAMRQRATRSSVAPRSKSAMYAIPPIMITRTKARQSDASELAPPVIVSNGARKVGDARVDEVHPEDTGVAGHVTYGRHLAHRVARGALRLLPVLCILAAVYYARLAVCSRRLERGRQAVAGTADQYAWPVRPESRERGAVLIEQAAGPAVMRAHAYYWAGVGRVRGYREKLENAISGHLKRFPELSRAQAERLVYATSGSEAVDAYSASCRDLRNAVQMMPWHANAHAMLARYAADLASLSASVERAVALRVEAMAQAEVAVLLAPSTPVTLVRACAAASTLARADDAGGKRARERVRTWGSHALRLSADVAEDVCVAFDRAHIPLDDLVMRPDTPLVSMARVVRLIQERGDSEQCLRVLARLEKTAIAATAQAERLTKPERDVVDSLLNMAQRETDRWLLRQGDWEGYGRRGAARRQLYARLTDRRIVGEAGPQMSEDIRLRMLTAVNERYGLDPRGTLLLASMASRLGRPAVATRLRCEVALRDPTVPLVLGTKAEEALSCVDVEDVGFRLLSARRMLDSGRYLDAMVYLQTLSAEDRLPTTMTHRLSMLLARCADMTTDHVDSPDTFLQEALELCPSDRDVLNAVVDAGMGTQAVVLVEGVLRSPQDILATQEVACEVRMQFLGGRVELLGFSLVEGEGLNGAPTLRMVWRFFGQVPAGLSAMVRCMDADGDHMFARRCGFAKQHAEVFRGGDPCIGSTVVSTVAIPPTELTSPRLLVGLMLPTSGWRWLPDASGLNFAEVLDWQQHITPKHAGMKPLSGTPLPR
jgi:O-antigen ligase